MRDAPPVEAKTRKGEQTRARIVEAALRLFMERGYEATTMRAVAKEAGVSLGNAYYYFASKEHLLQAYYRRIHDLHAAASADVLKTERDLKPRLVGVLERKLEVIEPFHRFSALLFKTAADPKSPLNPFHEESREARELGTQVFREVLEGSKLKIPADIGAQLPELLWIYSMGIVLFWIHDESPGRERTHRLVERTADLVAGTIGLLSNPLLRPLRKSALKTLEALKAPSGAGPGPQTRS